MKKILLIIISVVLLATATVQAKGPQGVIWSRHNLSSSGPAAGMYNATNEDEICIFCHTPHGGTLDGPLWNRNLPDQSGANNFTHYTSASLLPSVAGAWTQDRDVNMESLLCLSCHDGGVAVNNIINFSNRTGAIPDNPAPGTIVSIGFGAGVGAAIGDIPNEWNDPSGETRNLTDDHPISFSYYDLTNFDTNYASKLHSVTDAQNAGVRFFPPAAGAGAAGQKRVECSSCHDPHVNYENTANGGDTSYTPFLITPNEGSALCLACHIK